MNTDELLVHIFPEKVYTVKLKLGVKSTHCAIKTERKKKKLCFFAQLFFCLLVLCFCFAFSGAGSPANQKL